MNKNELAVALTKLRMTRLAESQGHPPAEAQAIAEEAMRQGGINGMAGMATPEGSIVTIVESHLQYIAKRCVQLGGPEYFSQANNEAIAAIEAHRSQFVAKGESFYPKDIDDYVYYRINLEIQHQFGSSADSMGLNRQTTKILTHTAKTNLLKSVGVTGSIKSSGTSSGSSARSGSKNCFIATACFGSCDALTVITLRRYREVILKRAPLGRRAIYSYYRLSPPIAAFIETHPRLKRLVRVALATLASWLARKHQLSAVIAPQMAHCRPANGPLGGSRESPSTVISNNPSIARTKFSKTASQPSGLIRRWWRIGLLQYRAFRGAYLQSHIYTMLAISARRFLVAGHKYWIAATSFCTSGMVLCKDLHQMVFPTHRA